ncbi:MAG: hypothetical protein KGK07_00055 [Chloroflexota bacterium]|nr:hypothetical protein [Chloroflexota bacterium]
MKRLGIAGGVAIVIYGAMLGLGTLLYATGAIGAGATHNDCVDFRHQIALRQGIADRDVAQSQVKAATAACLETHRLTKWHAFKTEYLQWAAWPAVVTAAIFLLWPQWAAALHRQEVAEAQKDAPGAGAAA